MKAPVFLCVGLVALASAQAQVFRPEAVNGAVVGGIAGAVIGNNSGSLNHNAWKGAAIGAGAGLLLGQAVGNANAEARVRQVPAPAAYGTYIYRTPPSIYVSYRDRWHSYGRGYSYGSYYGYGPSYAVGYYAPTYDDYGYRSAAADGLWLGALAGGIIGHNSGEFRHNGWHGAAWGAGVGWLLGTIVDANRRAADYEQPTVVTPVATPSTQTATPAAAPQQVTIINNYYGNSSSPMASANAMFGR